jgi:hypothetical protein
MKHLTEKILTHRSELDDLEVLPGRTHNFITSDTEQLWDYHLKSKKDEPSLHYYTINPIEYKLNNYGFRTPDDFNSEDWGNVYLGCSHTFGVGHHLENTWSYKLNRVVGGKFWNLGIGGTGVDTHFRVFLGFYKKLKVRNVFHYAPMYPRYEFLENKRPQSYIIADYNEKWIPKFGNLMLDSLLTDEQVELNWYKNTSAIRGLASEIGATYHLIQGSYDWHGRDDKSLLARDLLHYTTQYQHKVYQDFLKLYDIEVFNKHRNKQEPILDIISYMERTYNPTKLI